MPPKGKGLRCGPRQTTFAQRHSECQGLRVRAPSSLSIPRESATLAAWNTGTTTYQEHDAG